MPMQAMCTFGSETPRSALPSFVQTTKPPVSAMAKFTPVMPASAARNFCAQMLPGGFDQVGRIGRAGCRAEPLVKQVGRPPLS